MKYLRRIILLSIIISLGYYAIKAEFGTHEDGFFSFFSYSALLLLILILILTIYIESFYYKKTKKYYEFISSLIAFSILITILLHIFKISQIENSKSLFKVSSSEQADHVFIFDFKEKNNFVLTEYFRLGRDIYYGKYSTNYDTIKISGIEYNDKSYQFPKFGVIEKDTMIMSNMDTMILSK